MFNSLTTLLNQPYPDSDDAKSMLIGGFAGGLVVFLVLYLLKPFGLDRAGDRAWIYCLQFAGITIAISLLFDFCIRFVFGIRRDRPEWTLWKWLISISILILMITLGNYVFIVKTFSGEFTLRQFLQALYTTVVIGIFPISIFGTSNMIRLLRANQQIAASIRPSDQSPADHKMIALPINRSSKTFPIDASSILYVEAMQNYVNICYKTEDGISEEILRNTIAAIEKTLSSTPVRRCHRSFLVNANMIESISGNAQGLKLKLRGPIDVEIPVSRKFISEFRR